MIRANLVSGSADILTTGQYMRIGNSTSGSSGTISNDVYESNNDVLATIIGVEDYDNFMPNKTNGIYIAGFNDYSDISSLTISANQNTDISSYKYLLINSSVIATFTFS